MADPNLKIRIQTAAEGTGAKETAEGLREVRREADAASESLSKVTTEKLDAGGPISVDEVLPGLDALKKRTEELAKMEQAVSDAASAAPAGGGLMEMLGGGVGATAGVAVAVAGVVTLVGAVRELIGNLSEGATKASGMAVELAAMDEASRKAALEGLGELGQYLTDGAPELEKYARDIADINKTFEEMWTVAGARVIPSLSQLTDVLAGIDLTGVGAAIGNTFAGGIQVVTGLANVIKVLDENTALLTGTVRANAAIYNSLHPILQGHLGLLMEIGKMGGNSEKAITEQILRRGDAVASATEALDEYRRAQADASAPIESQIEALVDRQKRALQEGNAEAAVALEKEMQALREKDAQEKDAAATKAKQLAATKEEVALRTQLNEAVAAGNVEEQRKLEWMQQYNAILKQTGDEEMARSSANADLGRKQAADEQKLALQTLTERTALERELGQTRLAELRLAGATEAQIQRAKMEAADRVRALEVETAKVKGNSAQVEALQAQERLQDAAELARIEAEAGKKERLKALKDEAALSKAESDTRIAQMKANGASEVRQQQSRKAAADRIREIELQIAQIQGDAAQAEALHRQERLRDEAQIAAALNKENEGRKSAKLQKSPIGPSGIDQPLSLTDPASPRGLAGDLVPRLGGAVGAPGPGAAPQTTPPPTPAPTLPPAADAASGGNGQAGGDAGADAALAAVSALLAKMQEFYQEVRAMGQAGVAAAQEGVAAAASFKQALDKVKAQLDALKGDV